MRSTTARLGRVALRLRRWCGATIAPKLFLDGLLDCGVIFKIIYAHRDLLFFNIVRYGVVRRLWLLQQTKDAKNKQYSAKHNS